jgi:Holliday junction resolvase RusA-like endonuclease
MLSLTFTIPGEPQGKERPRFWRGRAVTPKKTRDYETRVRLAAKQALEHMVQLPDMHASCEVTIDAYYKIPKSYSKKQRQQIAESGAWVVRPGKPDLDNAVKILGDGLNGIVYHDDVQIVSLRAKKHWCEGEDLPRVDVKIEWGD